MSIVPGAEDRRARRQLFAEFLRARRERTDPRELGLVMVGRRRTPGLRREEIAQLAGMSVDYYTRLEQGRDLQPSAAVIDALARALQLGAAERDHLFRLAGTDPIRRTGTPSQTVRGTARRMLDIVAPNPALLVGPRMDILGWNPPCAALIVDFAAIPPPDRNLVRFVFLDPRARDVYGDWEQAALDCVGGLRRAAGQYPDDVPLRALIDELLAAAPEFAGFWARHGVKAKTTGGKVFTHPAVGRFTLDFEVMAIGDSDQSLIVYSAPAGSAAQASIELLAGLAPRR